MVVFECLFFACPRPGEINLNASHICIGGNVAKVFPGISPGTYAAIEWEAVKTHGRTLSFVDAHYQPHVERYMHAPHFGGTAPLQGLHCAVSHCQVGSP